MRQYCNSSSKIGGFLRDVLGLPHGVTAPDQGDGAARGEWFLAAMVALGCHLTWHWHGIRTGGFQNLDVAGIVYNARLLLAGRLPYVDSVEIKPPGAFLLFAPLLAMGGLKAVWWFSVAWGALTSLGTGWLGALCWGKRVGPPMVIFHAAGAALAADGDINYSFWMTLPVVLSTAFAVRATSLQGRRAAVTFWAASAGLAAFAAMVRPSALALGIVHVFLLVRRHQRDGWRSASVAAVACLAGVGLVLVFTALPFAHNGDIAAVLRGYASVRRYADESISSIVNGAGGRWRATISGMECLPDQLPVYCLLLAVSLLPVPARLQRNGRSPFPAVAWLFALSCFSGISLTLRFFTHDNAPIWPAITLLALRPSGLIGVVSTTLRRWRFVNHVIALVLGGLATANNWHSLTFMQGKLQNSDAEVARVCYELEPHMRELDTVLAWGWNAWGVYEHCRRWAPGPVYKDLTTVTTPNTNTCNRSYGSPRFKPGRLADRFLSDLDQRPPALIVLSGYYRALGGDPLDEWADFRRVIGERYVSYRSSTNFEALVRRDLASKLLRLSERRSGSWAPAVPEH